MEFIRQGFRLTEDTKANRDKLNNQQQQIEALAALVQRLYYEIERVSEHERYEREKLKLELEIERLRAERGLPAKEPNRDKPEPPHKSDNNEDGS